jgi:single stranded DNA-binding protein
MADTHVTLTGNLTDDPDLRFTPNGNPVANFRLAVTARIMDGDSWRDGDTSFFRVNVWRQLAEHVAESLTKGDRAVVIGRLKSRSWETPEGDKRSVVEVEADEVARPCGGPPPSPSAPPTATAARARASSTTTPPSASSEAGAAATVPASRTTSPSRRSLGCTPTLPDPAHARAGPAPAGRHLDRVLSHLRLAAVTARTQARCERRAARRRCPVCHQDGR